MGHFNETGAAHLGRSRRDLLRVPRRDVVEVLEIPKKDALRGPRDPLRGPKKGFIVAFGLVGVCRDPKGRLRCPGNPRRQSQGPLRDSKRDS